METPTEVIIGEDGKQYVVPKSKLRGFVDGVQGGAPPDPSMLPPDEGPTYEMGDTPVPPTPKQGPPPALDEPLSAGPAQAQAAPPPTLGTPGQPPSWMPGPGPQVSFAPPPAPQAPPPLGTPGQPPPVVAPAPPMQKKPGTLQRIGAGLLGGAAGYVNAAGRSHIDQSTIDDATQGVRQPGYGIDVANYQMKRQAAIDKSKLGLEDAQAKSALENAASNTEYREASAAQRKAAPGIATAKNVADAEAKRQATNEKLEQTMLKPWGDDAQLQKEGDPVAPGMEVTQSLTQPGMVWIHPPRMVPLPKGLADFAPGRTVGDLVPYSEFKKIQDRANENQIKNTNKPERLVANPDEVLLNPEKYSPAQIKTAQGLFDKMHRPPVNNNFMGATIPGMPKAQDTGNASVDKVLAKYPEQIRSLAQGLLDYRTVMPTGRNALQPAVQGALQAAREADPSFDPKNYPMQQKMMNYMSSGPGSKEVDAINVAIGHLSVLYDAADAMKNGDVRKLNQLANFLGEETGNNARVVYRSIVNRVAPETVRAYVGSGGDVGDRVLAREDFNPDNAPGVMTSVTRVSAKLLGSKIRFKQNQWDGQFHGKKPFPLPSGDVLTTESQAALTHIMGGKAGGGGNAGGNQGNAGSIRVKRKADGVTGTIDAKDFNPAKYDRVQ